MHLDDERLQRVIDGELPAAERAAVLEHLAGCPDCRRAKLEAETEQHRMQALLRELDEPEVERSGTRMALPGDRAVARGSRAGSFERRPMAPQWAVASLLLVLLAGAALAIPGTPVSRWAQDMLARVRREPARSQVTPRVETPAGIAVAPGERMVIEFPSAQGVATVRLTGGDELVIRAPNGAATFTSDVDRVRVTPLAPASFDIEIPRDAPFVEIQVAGSPRFRKEGSRVGLAEVLGEGAWRVPLSGP